jgi:CheY-like chemotaxis protein
MGRQLKITLADNDDAVRDHIQSWLSELGHEVCAVAGGWPLVNGCRQALPDLVICEVHLPDLDGISAVKQILRDGPVPAILMSASWDAASLGRAAVLGVPCLMKPLSPLTLVNAVETACRAILADPDRLKHFGDSTRLHLAFGT